MLLENIRKIFGLNPNEVSKKFMENSLTTFNELYYGEVVDTSDPEQMGRVKVSVYGILDEFQTSDIPWAIAETSFIGSKKGSMIIPPKGSIVTVRFQNGDIHLPIYLSSRILSKSSIAKGSGGSPSPDQLIFWETDNGSYFEIKHDLTGDEIELNHSSGASIKISKLGAISFHGFSIEDIGKSLVTPTGSGPFCGIPSCIYSGAPHSGSMGISINPIVKGV